MRQEVRLSSIQVGDLIFVFRRGQVVEVEKIDPWDKTPGGEVMTCRVLLTRYPVQRVRLWTDDENLSWRRL